MEGCCEICLVDCDGNDKNIAGSPNAECVHIFHSDCILEWLERKPTCPCCRATSLPKTKAVTDIEEETNDASEDKE
jgi:hypothetical protein